MNTDSYEWNYAKSVHMNNCSYECKCKSEAIYNWLVGDIYE